MRFGEIGLDEAEGAILAHSVRHARGLFKKGRRLTPEDISLLGQSGVERVFAARLDEGDVPEDEAADAVARAAAGENCLAQRPFTGRANIHALKAGIALVDAARVRALNRLHESLTLATVAPYDLLEERQMLATVKVIPFAVPREVLGKALEIVGQEPMVRIAPLAEHRVGLVVTTLPHVKHQLVSKTVEAIRDRLTALGSRLGEVVVAAHRIAEVAKGLSDLLSSGHAPVLVFGASAIVDRGDVVPQGIVSAGGEIVHLGMPVDPGNLMLLARVGPVPVVGVPSCARSPKLNGFDWVLARLLANLEVKAEDVMDMGAGGLLMEIPTRPSPREPAQATSARAPRIAALVLAAGLSSRMRGRNKLLETVGGVPMIRRTVETVLKSQAAPVIVVTGHEADGIREALAGLHVGFVHNPGYETGLASSLKAGTAAAPADCDGALVCLGDMPMVAAANLDRLIAAFSPQDGRLICVPVHGGKRGNPVLWARRYFSEFARLDGDAGARSLLGKHDEEIVEVAMSDDGILTDFDTPQAMESFRS